MFVGFRLASSIREIQQEARRESPTFPQARRRIVYLVMEGDEERKRCIRKQGRLTWSKFRWKKQLRKGQIKKLKECRLELVPIAEARFLSNRIPSLAPLGTRTGT